MSEAKDPDLTQPIVDKKAEPSGLLGLKSKTIIKHGSNILFAAFTSYLISKGVSKYNGTTLLFPISFRDIVIELGLLMGILTFEFGQMNREKNITHDEAHETNISKRLWWEIKGCFVALVVAVSALLFLRAYCVYKFNSTQWLTTQLLAVKYQQNKLHHAGDAQLAKDIIPAEGALAKGQTEATPEFTTAELDAITPEFVNREQGLICLPLWLPANDKKYVTAKEQMAHVDGIGAILDDQPGLIINWLTTDARMNLQVTTWIFLMNYLLIIGLAMYLLGLRFDPVKSLMEAFFDIRK